MNSSPSSLHKGGEVDSGERRGGDQVLAPCLSLCLSLDTPMYPVLPPDTFMILHLSTPFFQETHSLHKDPSHPTPFLFNPSSNFCPETSQYHKQSGPYVSTGTHSSLYPIVICKISQELILQVSLVCQLHLAKVHWRSSLVVAPQFWIFLPLQPTRAQVGTSSGNAERSHYSVFSKSC